MWTTGYLVRLAEEAVPPALIFALVALLLGGGAYFAARFGPRGLRDALMTGLTVALLNLLILGSLFSRKEQVNQIDLRLLTWGLPGWFAAVFAISAAGGWLGVTQRRPERRPIDWPGILGHVLVGLTLVLLLVGGVVTSADAGLAVVDWPNSFGYNMFLYPLSKMTGGIYFEHSHRLFGSLVGLATLLLAIYLQRHDARRWLKWLGWVAFVCVCIQGVMGGLRVTGKPTLSASAAETAPNTTLAIIHGTFAQVFFGLLVALATLMSRRWQMHRSTLKREIAKGPHWPLILIAALLIQLVLGVFLRHLGGNILPHIGMAILVATLTLAHGFRSWAFSAAPLLQRIGLALMAGIMLQLTLGIAALLVTVPGVPATSGSALELAIPTAHQTTGAILIGLAVANWLWTLRLAHAPASDPDANAHFQRCLLLNPPARKL